jgi:hypothetical protein
MAKVTPGDGAPGSGFTAVIEFAIGYGRKCCDKLSSASRTAPRRRHGVYRGTPGTTNLIDSLPRSDLAS